VERGTTSPSIESLKNISDALNIRLPEIFEGVGEGSSPKAELLELIRLCRERPDRDIELILSLAKLVFQRLRDSS
jgi:transcriptional regulator with XRE-family HTH domain